jgi:hypothetical protein
MMGFDDLESKVCELLFEISSAEAEEMIVSHPGEVIFVRGVCAGKL